MIKIDNDLWLQIQRENPIVHSISNQVTANDSANILLAIGASPIMADETKEMKDITNISHATVLNIGTPNDALFEASLLAGKKANELGQPLIIDPVGVGASDYRKEKMAELLKQVQPTIICANSGEILTLVGQENKAHGVDSIDEHVDNGRFAADELAQKFKCTVFLSGAKDYITDGSTAYTITGGHKRMQQITGTGCMLSVISGAMSTTADPVTAAVNASYAWKVCAELAGEANKGIGQMRVRLFDYAEQIPDLFKKDHQVFIKKEEKD